MKDLFRKNKQEQPLANKIVSINPEELKTTETKQEDAPQEVQPITETEEKIVEQTQEEAEEQQEQTEQPENNDMQIINNVLVSYGQRIQQLEATLFRLKNI